MIHVSAGHHPDAKGAQYEGFNEYDEAVLWADRLVELLGDEGIRVPNGVLRDKVAFINANDPTICLEIHFNAAMGEDGPIGRGSETLYYPGSETGRHLATACQGTLGRIFPPDRGVKEGWYRMDPSRGPDFFLARTPCPAVIIEPDFIHRKEIIQDNRERACLELAVSLKEFVHALD